MDTFPCRALCGANKESDNHLLDPPAIGQAVIFLKRLSEAFYSELSNLATVSDNSVRFQAITFSDAAHQDSQRLTPRGGGWDTKELCKAFFAKFFVAASMIPGFTTFHGRIFSIIVKIQILDTGHQTQTKGLISPHLIFPVFNLR